MPRDDDHILGAGWLSAWPAESLSGSASNDAAPDTPFPEEPGSDAQSFAPGLIMLTSEAAPGATEAQSAPFALGHVSASEKMGASDQGDAGSENAPALDLSAILGSAGANGQSQALGKTDTAMNAFSSGHSQNGLTAESEVSAKVGTHSAPAFRSLPAASEAAVTMWEDVFGDEPHIEGCPCGDCTMPPEPDEIIEKVALSDIAGASPADPVADSVEFADIPDNATTTDSVAVGSTYIGTLEVAGDRDWIKVDLVAGQTYTFDLSGSGANGVADTYLRLYAPGSQDRTSGILVAEDDDSGIDRWSSLRFEATQTGTYFIDVGAWNDQEAGDYAVAVAEYAAPEPGSLGEMADFLRLGYWNSTTGRYHNVGSTGTDANDGVLHYNVSWWSQDADGLTEDRKVLVREAFKLFEAALGIQFIETTSQDTSFTDFFFFDNQSGAYAGSSVYSSGVINYSYINIAQSWSGGTSTYDDYTFQTIIHEIGHALGLGHQGPYNGSASYGVDALFPQDSWQASMMSYFSQTENTFINASYEFLQTPMSVDWMALDDIYGAQTGSQGQTFGTENAFVGDTIYGFNTNITADVSEVWNQFATWGSRTASTIVDAGGVDTLDVSGYGANQYINLATTSRADTMYSTSNIGGSIGNLTIAEGTVIENAKGGSGSDIFIGNFADNSFWGNGGDDTFNDSEGSDSYFGGDGTGDRVVFFDVFENFVFEISGTFLSVVNVTVDFAVDLVEDTVEWLDFANSVTWSFSAIVDLIGTTPAPTVNALTTNDPTPEITGTATLGAAETLSVTVGSQTFETVSVSGGVWSVTPTVLADGTYDVIATVLDESGATVSVDTSENELVIDTTPPSAPTVTAIGLTNDATPDITGTATLGAGETLSVTVGGQTFDNVAVTNGGDWSVTPATLADGAYEVVATVTDAAGNSVTDTSIGELVIDTTPPTIPTVVSLTTNDTTPEITGTATLGDGETLNVTVGVQAFEAVAVTGGLWSVTPTVLADGTYEVVATVTDAAGNSVTDTSIGELVIDTTPPTVPTVDSLTTNNTTPEITGTASLNAGETLSVSVGSQTFEAVAVTGGLWSVTPTALAEGTYEVVATVTDAAGNTISDITGTELVIDTTPPAVSPTVNQLITENTSPEITGTATLGAGETLSVTVGSQTFEAVAVTDGVWSVTPTALFGGTYDVVAAVTDEAGNRVTDTSTGELVITAGATLTGTDGNDDIVGTNGSDTLIGVPEGSSLLGSGTVDRLTGGTGADVFVLGDSRGVFYDDGNDKAGNNGTADYAVITDFGNGADTIQLSGTRYLLEAWSIDGISGTAIFLNSNNNRFDNKDELIGFIQNVAPSDIEGSGSDGNLTLSYIGVSDTTPPVVTVDVLSTDDATPLLTGSIDDPTASVSVIVNGETYSAVNGGAGTWSAQVTTPLAPGAYDIQVTATDPAGNIGVDSSSGELTITADTTPPVVTVDVLSTDDATPLLTGSIDDPTASVSVIVNDETYSAVNGGAGTWSAQVTTPLALGVYDIQVTATDPAGNIGVDSSGGELTITLAGGPIYGTDGSDTLTGSEGDDIISGLPNPSSGSATLGAGTIDFMTGLGGADLFILGDSRGAFYDDGNDKSGNNGTNDYAYITDFEDGIDKIQLAGDSSRYLLDNTWALGGVGGWAVFLDSNGDGQIDKKDELVGFVADDTITLGFADDFNFV